MRRWEVTGRAPMVGATRRAGAATASASAALADAMECAGAPAAVVLVPASDRLAESESVSSASATGPAPEGGSRGHGLKNVHRAYLLHRCPSTRPQTHAHQPQDATHDRCERHTPKRHLLNGENLRLRSATPPRAGATCPIHLSPPPFSHARDCHAALSTPATAMPPFLSPPRCPPVLAPTPMPPATAESKASSPRIAENIATPSLTTASVASCMKVGGVRGDGRRQTLPCPARKAAFEASCMQIRGGGSRWLKSGRGSRGKMDTFQHHS
eukprot:355514-Chlamydomonas_euryale.AAC.5